MLEKVWKFRKLLFYFLNFLKQIHTSFSVETIIWKKWNNSQPPEIQIVSLALSPSLSPIFWKFLHHGKFIKGDIILLSTESSNNIRINVRCEYECRREEREGERVSMYIF